MNLKTFLYGIALFAIVSLLVVSCKKSDVNVNDSTTVITESVSTERKFGLVQDDPNIVAKVPFIISSDFMVKKQENILNQLRTIPVKGGSKDDTSPPTVSITSPQNGTSVTSGSIVNVAVNASDNKGVTSVTFKVDETIVSTSTSSPYNFTWNTTGVASGTHTLTATGRDAAGNIGISSVVITVNTTVIIAPPTSTSAHHIKMPPVTTQGSEGSCVSFAVGYNTRSAEQYYATGSSTYSYSANIFSPEYLFNQTRIDASCSASTIFSALELLKTNGICTWQSMPYSSTNGCSLLPTASQVSEAANFKIRSYSQLYTSDITAIKSIISANHPLIISFNVDTYFYYAGPGFIWKNYSGTFLGQHAVVICGYDDAKHAFKIVNSWGTGWGDAGYTWIDYDFLPVVSPVAAGINL